MRPSEALNRHREEVRHAAKRYGVANPRVFGSTARGEDSESSDLDLLVDKGERTTMFDLDGLEQDLRDLLGVKVEVVISSALHPRIRRRVLEEAVPV